MGNVPRAGRYKLTRKTLTRGPILTCPDTILVLTKT
jgi:hypothetical protein